MNWRKSCFKAWTLDNITMMRREFDLARECMHLNFHLKLYKEDIKVGKLMFTPNYR